jgi:SAM-dependent methyltransferase
MNLSKTDINNIIERYNKRYQEYGYDPKTLGWDKGKQDIRFDILTSQYNFNNKTILDIGCGFGDLNKTLGLKFPSYHYVGIDIVDTLLKEANKNFIGKNITFVKNDILKFNPGISFDYAIASGVFNHKLSSGGNYLFIEAVIKKALSICKDGLAFDFLSDKVDHKLAHTFHSRPEKILSIAYKYSRNIILRNDYMPFEFSIFIFKNDMFRKNDTIFNYYKIKKTGSKKD